MTHRRYLSFVLAIALTGVASAVEGKPYFAIDGAPPRYAIRAYEDISGKAVAMSEEVKASRTPIFASYGGESTKAALDLLSRALLEQASVEMVSEKDGRLVAQVVPRKQPNKSPEPTTTSGTSAAEQPLVPAAVVAHL